ncbi:MAG: bifunctional phosphoribosyl-AMP cyclohydrolase/phosphoribosyl-ATP diphosphatase HisIE [Nitrospiria bacterium]
MEESKALDINLGNISFKEGLIPAVIQDHRTQAILMLAYMNPESLRLSLKTGETHFWSRSRQRLWRKGATSGHIQKIKKIYLDCDQDTLLVHVEQVGPACHTGRRTCFFRTLAPDGRLEEALDLNESKDRHETSPLVRLSNTINDRKKTPSSKSYTSLLLREGIDRLLKKVGEESAELIVGAKNGDKKEIVHESADLLYHLLVTLAYFDIPFKDIEEELARRSAQSGLEEKRARGGPNSEKPTS